MPVVAPVLLTDSAPQPSTLLAKLPVKLIS